jgi:uncharacterized cupredoxin-like copper-binding protein
MRALRLGGLAIIAVVLATAAVVVASARDQGSAPVTNATIAIHFSKFETTRLTVPAGVPVTFVLKHEDPIGHEWIVGDSATHARHRTGTEPYHDEVPTEVSLRAFETKTTVVVFDEPGTYKFICHLPGHEEYGMKGTIEVVSQD